MTNQNKTIYAGLIMMAAILSVSVTYSTAFAQVLDLETEAIERPLGPHTFLVGTGVAVGEDDQGWRSHFRMGIVQESETTDVDAHTEYKVKRGVFIVGKYDTRLNFSVIPDTWQISASPNMKSIDASGTVENRDGKFYDIEISGEKISDLQDGNLYYVTGTATGADSEVYDLFYISALAEKTPSTQTKPSRIQ
ncbi:MAG: hypothetical protein OEQ12_03845 [Nitrosopumilus sp.]|nr:hypothetical protein [Nitrosopumilus sp.]